MIGRLVLHAGLDGLVSSLIRPRHGKLHAAADIGLVFGLSLDQYGVHALPPCRLTRRAGAGKRIKHRAALGRYQPHEVLHEVEGLDGWMLGTEPVIAVGLGCVEEAGGGAGISMTSETVCSFQPFTI